MNLFKLHKYKPKSNLLVGAENQPNSEQAHPHKAFTHPILYLLEMELSGLMLFYFSDCVFELEDLPIMAFFTFEIECLTFDPIPERML